VGGGAESYSAHPSRRALAMAFQAAWMGYSALM